MNLTNKKDLISSSQWLLVDYIIQSVSKSPLTQSLEKHSKQRFNLKQRITHVMFMWNKHLIILQSIIFSLKMTTNDIKSTVTTNIVEISKWKQMKFFIGLKVQQQSNFTMDIKFHLSGLILDASQCDNYIVKARWYSRMKIQTREAFYVWLRLERKMLFISQGSSMTKILKFQFLKTFKNVRLLKTV